MSQFPPIYVKEPAWFRDFNNYCGLQEYYRNVSVSRRKIPVEIHRDIFNFKGEILFPSGRVWPRPYCIHIVFDPENRWHSNYLKVSENGKPLYHSDIISRLQVYELGVQLETFEKS